MTKLRLEKKPAPPTITRVLPMRLQVGDRLADETGEGQSSDRRTPRAQKAPVKKVGQPDRPDVGRPTSVLACGAHDVSADLQAFTTTIPTALTTRPSPTGPDRGVPGVVCGRWVTPEEAGGRGRAPSRGSRLSTQDASCDR